MSNAIVIDNIEWAQYPTSNISDDKTIGEFSKYMESLLNKCGKVPKDYLDRVCKNPDTIKDCMEILDNCFEDDNIEI